MAQTVTMDQTLDAAELAANTAHRTIIRVDFPLPPRRRPELPFIEVLSGSYQGWTQLDPHRRLVSFRQQNQWDVNGKVEQNDISCLVFSKEPDTCQAQMEALLQLWSDERPEWTRNEATVITVQGQRPATEREQDFVCHVLESALARFYEGLRAEILHAKAAARQQYGRPKRLAKITQDEWSRRHGFTLAPILEERTMRSIMFELSQLQDRCRSHVDSRLDERWGF